VIGNVLVFADDDHLTVTYARTLAPLLAPQLQAALPAARGRATADGRGGAAPVS
jgi:hypothetical protein